MSRGLPTLSAICPSSAGKKILQHPEPCQRGGVTGRSGEHEELERLFVAGFVPYCGAAPVPGGLHWNFDPVLIGPLLVLAVANLMFAHSRGVVRWDLAATVLGWLILSLAFISPLCNLSVALFSARVAQHMTITLVAAPLIARGLLFADTPYFGVFWTGQAIFVQRAMAMTKGVDLPFSIRVSSYGS
jgi:caa3-type cytochrome oxidase assembly factor Caa3/CtaG